MVTIDAAGCQREIAKKIIDGESDYVFSLKGNQGKLQDAVTDYITEHMENDFATHLLEAGSDIRTFGLISRRALAHGSGKPDAKAFRQMELCRMTRAHVLM